MTKPDIMLTKANLQQTVQSLLQGVQICSNRKRQSKKAELYLRCGGGYDTESTTVTDDAGKPLFAFVYHVQICINGQYMYFRDMQLIAPFFIELCHAVKAFQQKKKQPKLIIWVANLAHEYAFFKRQLAYVGITDLFAKKARQPIKITLQNCVEFRECLGLFGRSLSKVAENYTTTQKLKGDLDYNLIRVPDTPLTPTEYAYCKNDVMILDELSEVAFTKFTDHELKIPMTETGILRQHCKACIKNIKAEYKANMLLMPETEQDYYLQRRYMYAGGLSGTSPIYAGKKIDKAKCADITSDYPAQINHNMYPSGRLVECPPTEIKLHKRQFRIILFTCDISAKTAHAVLSVHKILNWKNNTDCPFTDTARSLIINNGKIQFGKNVCLMLNNTDIAALSELYNITNIQMYRTWYFTAKARAPRFLLDCMNADYKLKKQLKDKGLSHTIEYKECKGRVNSYYGMTATKLYDCMFGYDELSEDIDEIPDEKGYNYRRSHMWLSPYIGYWCTSYARALLMHFIARYPDLILQYDTDSLYYITDDTVVSAARIAEFEKELKKFNKRIELKNYDLFHGDADMFDLGTWDIDKDDYTGFKGIGAKRYLKQLPDGTLQPVVAGMVKESFDDYVQTNHFDAFEVFNDDLSIDRVMSKKLASVYYDGNTKTIVKDGRKKKVPDYTAPIRCEKVTDYLGNTEIIEITTFHALFAIEFCIKDISEYMYLCQMIQQEKALPAKYRQYEKYFNDWSVNNATR